MIRLEILLHYIDNIMTKWIEYNGKRKKLFGESESGNPIIKMNGNLVQVPIEHTNYESEEWISNSLYSSSQYE